MNNRYVEGADIKAGKRKHTKAEAIETVQPVKGARAKEIVELLRSGKSKPAKNGLSKLQDLANTSGLTTTLTVTGDDGEQVVATIAPESAAARAGAAIAAMDGASIEEMPEKLKEAEKALDAALDGTKSTLVEVKPAEGGSTPMLAGVLMQCTLHSSIGVCAATENSRYAIESVVVLRDNPVNSGSTREPVSKKCVYVATDGRMLACSFGSLVEREASNYQDLWTRIPADYCKLGSESRTISLASSPDQGLFGLERAWCIDGRHQAPVQEGPFPPICDVIPEIDPKASVIIGVNVELLANLAKAINMSGDENAKIVRLIVPREFAAAGAMKKALAAVGSAGIGVLMPVSVEDPIGYIQKFNDDRIEILRMHGELPEEARKAPPVEATLTAAGSGANDTGDPWYAAWCATLVSDLGLTPALVTLLESGGVKNIGDIQAINQKNPEKGLRSIKGLGAGKSDTIGAATNKRWAELKAAHTLETTGSTADAVSPAQ